MSHNDEYGDAMVKMLEAIWGVGYMAPGGAGSVAKMLSGLEPRQKSILDIGSGTGGPAIEMARTHGAHVVGIDLEAPLIARARAYAKEASIEDQCKFEQVEVGPLPFDDNHFDIVVSAGAMTQTKDKLSMFGEIKRVLKPGGWFSTYDWMKVPGPYSEDMRYWFETEGLTYEMVTIEEQADLLAQAGYESIYCEDATDWYKKESVREYDLIRGELYPSLETELGKSDADEFVENWRALTVVIGKGEMRQVYCRGQVPV